VKLAGDSSRSTQLAITRIAVRTPPQQVWPAAHNRALEPRYCSIERGQMIRTSWLRFTGVMLIASSGCGDTLTQEDHRRALLDTREAWSRAIAEGDVDRIFTFWTDDVVIYPVGEPPVRGIAAVREYVRRNRQGLGLTPRGAGLPGRADTLPYGR
jgi:hypothetical protein